MLPAYKLHSLHPNFVSRMKIDIHFSLIAAAVTYIMWMSVGEDKIKKMEGKVSDAGAFCASLADKMEPDWRSKGKDKD